MMATGRVKSSVRAAAARMAPVVAQVGLEVVGGAGRVAGQQRPGVREHDRVVVDVDDPRVRGGPLRDLVGVVRGGDPGADVEELPDAGLRGQVAHGPAEERAVAADAHSHERVGRHELLGQLAVGGEVVLAAEPVVVDPGDMRDAGIERRGLIREHARRLPPAGLRA